MFALLCYDAQTPPHNKCLVTKRFVCFVSMAKGFQLHMVFHRDNIEKSDQKSIKVKDVVNSNKEDGTTNEILL